MANSNYPFGTPLASASATETGLPLKNGKFMFVDATTGSDGATGLTEDDALASIARALVLAQSGDIIMIAPGSYDENLSVTKDYITMIGLSLSGYARPDVVPTTGMALSVHAQGFSAKHMRFAGAGVGGIGIQMQGNGWLLEDCVIESASNHGLRLFPDADDDSFTASEGLALNCLIRDCGGSGISFECPAPGLEGGVGPTDNVIKGCRFYGNALDIGDVNGIGTNNQTFTRCLVEDCEFMSQGVTAYIDLSNGTASAQGMIASSIFADQLAAASEVVLPAGVIASGNFDEKGVVDGSNL